MYIVSIERALLVLSALSAAHGALAQDSAQALPAPGTLVTTKAWAAPEEDVATLKFSDFFRRPIGPRGLEPSEALNALQGRRVRIVGYMAAAALPMAGRMILAPMPVELGDEDEHLADDLPPQAVFVHLQGPAATQVVPNHRGLLALIGRLDLGAREEPDGHVSSVRLWLDADASAACLPESAPR